MKFIRELLQPNSGVSSKRFCGILGFIISLLISIFIIIFADDNEVKLEVLKIDIIASGTLLGVTIFNNLSIKSGK